MLICSLSETPGAEERQRKEKISPHFCLGSFIYIYILYICFSEYLCNFLYVILYHLCCFLIWMIFFSYLCSLSLCLSVFILNTMWLCLEHWYIKLIIILDGHVLSKNWLSPFDFTLWQKKRNHLEVRKKQSWPLFDVLYVFLFWHIQHNTHQRQFIEVFPIRCLESVSWGKKQLAQVALWFQFAV